MITAEFVDQKRSKILHFILRMNQRFGVKLTHWEFDALNNIFANKQNTPLFKVRIYHNRISMYKEHRCIEYYLDLICVHKNLKIPCKIIFNTVYKVLVTILPLD